MRSFLIKIKNFTKTFLRMDFISFLIIFLLGYLLGMMRFHEYFGKINISKLTAFAKPLIKSILNITPNTDFLSDIASFEAVIVALAIPLSFEIISRISERYQSEVVSKKFEQEKINRWLPILLLFNIIMAISLRFATTSHASSLKWKIVAWVMLFSFIGIAIALFYFTKKMKEYMQESNVLNKLFEDAKKSIKK